jgi:hypothetical protein
MSKQNSVLKVKGKLDGVSYYENGNKQLARKAKGPSKSRINTGESFQRTRENMSEFGGAIAAAKSFRMGFQSVHKSLYDSRLTNRLTAFLKQVMNRDTESIRGQREILLASHKESMEQFEFNLKTPFSSIFKVPYAASANDARNELAVKLTAVDPSLQVNFPPNVNYCRLVLAVGVFSNHAYDMQDGKYLPVNKPINGIGVVTRSELISKDALSLDISLTASLPGLPQIDEGSSVIQCLGIEFYNLIGTKEYLFAQNNAMAVVKVW